MNHYNANTKGGLVDTAPLFASVWLALFNELHKSYMEYRLESAGNTPHPEVKEKN
jgi:hypothetical protein